MHVLIFFFCDALCGRFHVLTEFDEAKRSCRKRLAEHNRRRRKPATTAVPSKDGSSSPTAKKPNNAGAITSPYTTDHKSKNASSSDLREPRPVGPFSTTSFCERHSYLATCLSTDEQT
jgi:hypothetical protein